MGFELSQFSKKFTEGNAKIACEQALIFVVIIDVARTASAASRRESRLSFCQTPRLSHFARPLVTRGFAARATSIITTKMRACSQANAKTARSILQILLR